MLSFTPNPTTRPATRVAFLPVLVTAPRAPIVPTPGS